MKKVFQNRLSKIDQNYCLWQWVQNKNQAISKTGKQNSQAVFGALIISFEKELNVLWRKLTQPTTKSWFGQNSFPVQWFLIGYKKVGAKFKSRLFLPKMNLSFLLSSCFNSPQNLQIRNPNLVLKKTRKWFEKILTSWLTGLRIKIEIEDF